MPRGRPKQKAVEAELLPPEEDQPKVREIKHKTEWIEVAPVEEAPEDDADFEDVEIEDRPKKRNKNAIQEMRKKLRAQGVTPSSNLRLYIERYVHSETDAGGSWAETEFCTKYGTTEAHILSKDYIDAARKWGPGKYRITIRMDNRIVDAFDERISAPPVGHVIQNINPADPNSPQVIVQMPEGMTGQQPVGVIDPRKIFKEHLEMEKAMLEMEKLRREAYGLSSDQSANQPRSEEEVLTTAILSRPEVIDNVVGSVIKRFGGKAGGDSDPWADVAMEVIKSGQAPQMIRELITGLFNGFGSFFPGRQDHGTPPMAPTPLPNQAGIRVDSLSSPQGHTQSQESLQPGGDPRLQTTNLAREEHSNAPAPNPEDQALTDILNYVVGECANNKSPILVAEGIERYIDTDVHPFYQGSIWARLDAIALLPVEQVIDFVKALPGGERIASLPHAKEWTTELQRLIRESQEGEK